ncbi:photosystem I reaction center subunit II chloroplastic [Tripterygium wilfordii]|uniref:Photosystem I reaction center subunit II, chloroplastic n=1 Tax=Tripterygium wilfordii TaxID=458696 RepID=A0A7J7CRX6_TRIWF|nr:photosystem I reaction center subunit II chloroplastic [Tripterygium wilfordii]
MAMAKPSPTLFTLTTPNHNPSVLPWKQPSISTPFSPKTLKLIAPQRTTITVAAADGKTDAPTAEAPVGFTPPKLDPSTPSPIFAGSTGGLLRKAQVEEFYVITWDFPKRTDL